MNSDKNVDDTLLQAYAHLSGDEKQTLRQAYALLSSDQKQIRHRQLSDKSIRGRYHSLYGWNKATPMRRAILCVVGVTLALGTVVTNANMIYGLLSAVFPINTTGVLASADIQVYWESQCTNEASLINWGVLDPGQSKHVTVYIKNTGSIPLTLSFNTTNWNPSAASAYIVISWDYGGSQIQSNQVLAVTFILTVSENINGVTSFSFDIHVTGTQTT